MQELFLYRYTLKSICKISENYRQRKRADKKIVSFVGRVYILPGFSYSVNKHRDYVYYRHRYLQNAERERNIQVFVKQHARRENKHEYYRQRSRRDRENKRKLRFSALPVPHLLVSHNVYEPGIRQPRHEYVVQ